MNSIQNKSQKLQSRLSSYGMTTTAILSLSYIANAQIEYSGEKNLTLPKSAFELDVNNDNATDFTLSTRLVEATESNPTSHLFLDMYGAESFNNWLVKNGNPKPNGFKTPLPVDGKTKIDSLKNDWELSVKSIEEIPGAPDKVIGYRFDIDGKIHYGWLRIDINKAKKSVTIVDWAYNSNPNEGITAGAK
ncbi:MAG: hypothetical protein MI922_24385 [Bacteroidales bacterium]|nr:hypothetical protein [Bacteroidales bacterium]